MVVYKLYHTPLLTAKPDESYNIKKMLKRKKQLQSDAEGAIRKTFIFESTGHSCKNLLKPVRSVFCFLLLSCLD